jgi:eukaryotic-like serine/threonine-protein kinase
MFLVGEKIGNYTILKLLGRGGMGEVYLGEHRRIARKAAIKIIRRDGPIDEHLVARFFTEARAASLIEHPGIVEILDCDVPANGPPFIVMEYLEGESLEACIARVPRLGGDFDASRTIVGQVADALAAAHAKGIVHRDLKPANVFLAHPPPGAGQRAAMRVKVLDFGIAKLASAAPTNWTQTGVLLGTPVYMSPEQCKGAGAVDHRSDIYSLGCMAYEMCCGQPPFVRAGHGELIFAHMSESPPPMSRFAGVVPPELERLVMNMLAKRPEDRPQSMDEVASRLQAASPETPGSARTMGLPPRDLPAISLAGPAGGKQTTFTQSTGAIEEAMGTTRRGRFPAALATLMGVAAAGGGYYLWSRSPAGRPPEPIPVVERQRPGARPPPPPPIEQAAEPRPPEVAIEIASTPPGATVWVDGQRRGVTPLVLSVKAAAGNLEVRLERDGHLPRTLSIPADRDGRFQAALEKQVGEKPRRPRPPRRPAADPGDEYKKLTE